jgi:hypothetical protein
MPPVIVPIVQVKVLGMLAVRPIFGPVPLQVVADGEFVTVGKGLTVTVTFPMLAPLVQPEELVAVTVY